MAGEQTKRLNSFKMNCDQFALQNYNFMFFFVFCVTDSFKFRTSRYSNCQCLYICSISIFQVVEFALNIIVWNKCDSRPLFQAVLWLEINASILRGAAIFTFALLQQRCNDGFVFDGVERAGGVNHPSSHGQLLHATHSDAYLEPEHTQKNDDDVMITTRDAPIISIGYWLSTHKIRTDTTTLMPVVYACI